MLAEMVSWFTTDEVQLERLERLSGTNAAACALIAVVSSNAVLEPVTLSNAITTILLAEEDRRGLKIKLVHAERATAVLALLGRVPETNLLYRDVSNDISRRAWCGCVQLCNFSWQVG